MPEPNAASVGPAARRRPASRWKSVVVTVLLSIAALLVLPGDCYRPPLIPHVPSGPTQVAVRETAYYRTYLVDERYTGSARYFFAWGDGRSDTTGYFSAEDTVTASHAWDSIGAYLVAVGAQGDSGFRGVWSDPLSVTVYSDSERVYRDTFAD